MHFIMDKRSLTEKFITYITEKQKYPHEVIKNNFDVLTDKGETKTVDIAIVVNDRAIQSFMLYPKDTKNIEYISYKQTIDSVDIPAETLAAIYDDDCGKWDIKSKSQSQKCFLLFSTASKEFVKDAKQRIRERESSVVSELKQDCNTLFWMYTTYFALYAVMYFCCSGDLFKFRLPLSWELLALLTIITLCRILPTLVQYVRMIKFKGFEIELLAENLSSTTTDN